MVPPRAPWRQRAATLVVVVALVAVAGGAGSILATLGNLKRSTVDIIGSRPDNSGDSINILLIGSDTREGNNATYGGAVEGARGDATLLLNISGDRTRATAVSIPRDSMVNIPACRRDEANVLPPTYDMFNSAFARGGPSCTIATLEQATRIRVDHFVVVDFAGFKNMVNALGTVNICLPTAVNDRASGLHLPAGRQEVNGEQGLAYVRLRKTGDGSDLSRIKRQQAFLAAMAQKATSAGVITNPRKLQAFLRATTESMTVDEDLTRRKMATLALAARNIGLSDIKFVTVPNEPWVHNPSRVQWSPAADDLWNALRHDEPLNAPAPDPADPAAKAKVKTPPGEVRVRVLNGTANAGLATTAAEDLRRRGFVVESVGNADKSTWVSSVVRADPAYDESARTLTASVPGAKTAMVAGHGPVLELVVGSSWNGTQEVRVQKSGGGAINTRSADQDVCS